MALISQSELEARLGRSLTASEASDFTIRVAALQAYVEKALGVSVEDVEPTTRYYDGGLQHLSIGPVSNISAVNYVDDDNVSYYTFDSSDYTLEPSYSAVKTELRTRTSHPATGMNNVAVTGEFTIAGDAGLVSIVKDAMLNALAANTRTLASGGVKKESIEGYSVEYGDSGLTTEAQTLLAPIFSLFSPVVI